MLSSATSSSSSASAATRAATECEISQREQRLSLGLAKVIGVTDQLLLCPDEDTLVRRAVELAREELGVERFAIFLDLPDHREMRGTYGTDLQGQTTQEGAFRIPVAPSNAESEGGPMRWTYRNRKYLEENTWGCAQDIQRDWMVVTPILSASGRVGVAFQDAAISNAPVDETLLDIVTIYCSMLGSMIESKRATEEVRRSQRETSEGLGLVLDLADELVLCEDLDSLLRRTIEMARARLGIERLGIFLKNGDEEFLHGTYGIDRQGILRDERALKVGIGALDTPTPAGKNALSRLKIYQRARSEDDIQSDLEDRIHRDWVVTTPIQSSQGVIGVCFNDNALSKTPMDEAQQEKLAVFCSMLGNMIESKRAGQAMRESQRSIATLMSNLPGMAYRCRNDSLWTVEFVSEGALALTGYTPDALVGNRDIAFAQLMAPGEREAVWSQVQNALREHHSFQITYHIATAGGEPKCLSDQGSGIFSDDGELLAIEGFISDITDRERAGEELRRAKDELEARVEARTAELASANEKLRLENLERQLAMTRLHEVAQALRIAKDEAEIAREEAERANAAKSEFLSRMSHELRTPLNAILGFGQVLRMDALGPRADESVGHILKAGHHLLNLINEVLDIARVEAGHLEIALEAVALEPLVAECCALVRPLSQERKLCFEANLAQFRGKSVRADQQRLKQVVLNLLGNAIKYNIEGGRVLLELSEFEGRTRLAVRDTGLGIAPADIERLFSPFERLGAANSGVEGTGLGLVLSRSLVEAMGGSLQVESPSGEATADEIQGAKAQGSTFFIELPGCEDAPSSLASAIATECDLSPAAPAPKAQQVLVIEDNLSNLRLLEVLLESRPHVKLSAAMQGSIGLDLARQHPPDLILLDLNLPDISGKDVLDRLQESPQTREVPVVIISADATGPQIERLLAAGARRYLTKPLDVRQFLDVVDELLEG